MSKQLTPTSHWLGFVAMCLAMFMAILDIQIVVTSLPAIRDALDISAERMSWIQTSYLIAEVIAIPITAFLTRAWSLRGLFLGALGLFVAASVACALAPGFNALIGARIIQGLAGGCLIPLVFSAIFLMFEGRSQGVATTIAGALAVLAPTLGPAIGGYITESYSWPWLFWVNVVPGGLAIVVAYATLPRSDCNPQLLKRLHWVGLVLLAIALASLELALKEGPTRGWFSWPVMLLFTLSLSCTAGFIRGSLSHRDPVTQLRLLQDRNFAVAGALSFILGVGLFASVYLMPVFLGLVRDHGPLMIGLTMIVTGVSQLIVAPFVVQFELRFDARALSAIGFTLFAIGLGLSGFQTPKTDFDEMLWPQVLRGVGIMFCLIPPTRLALSFLQPKDVPDGSALFNLMRNLGGAIGIALVDTVIWQRVPAHAHALGERLAVGEVAAAQFVGIPLAFLPKGGVEPSAAQISMATPMVENAALVLAINDAWLLIAGLTATALVLLSLARRVKPQMSGEI